MAKNLYANFCNNTQFNTNLPEGKMFALYSDLEFDRKYLSSLGSPFPLHSCTMNSYTYKGLLHKKSFIYEKHNCKKENIYLEQLISM